MSGLVAKLPRVVIFVTGQTNTAASIVSTSVFTAFMGQEVKPLTVKQGNTNLDTVFDVKVSDDGRYAAFLYVQRTALTTPVQTFGVFVLSLRERIVQTIRLMGSVDSYAWQPSGETLAIRYRNEDQTKFGFYNPQNGSLSSWRAEGVSSWVWCGPKAASVLCLDARHNVVERAVKDGSVQHQWNVPKPIKEQTNILPALIASPDRKSILLVDFNAIYLCNMPPGKWVAVVKTEASLQPTTVRWSPDGKWLCYESIVFKKTKSPDDETIHDVLLVPTKPPFLARSLFSWVEREYAYVPIDWSLDSSSLFVLQRSYTKCSFLTSWSQRDASNSVVCAVDGFVMSAALAR